MPGALRKQFIRYGAHFFLFVCLSIHTLSSFRHPPTTPRPTTPLFNTAATTPAPRIALHAHPDRAGRGAVHSYRNLRKAKRRTPNTEFRNYSFVCQLPHSLLFLRLFDGSQITPASTPSPVHTLQPIDWVNTDRILAPHLAPLDPHSLEARPMGNEQHQIGVGRQHTRLRHDVTAAW